MEERRQSNTTRLYNRILEYEERLNKLRFNLPGSVRSGDHGRLQWLECRYHLRVLQEELVVSDCEFVEVGKLMASWWSRMWWTPIEQLRDAKVDDVLRQEANMLIDEGVGFYMVLYHRLNKWCDRDVFKRIMYECLIYVGDLTRYRDGMRNTNTGNSVDLMMAAGHYRNAAKLLPYIGHAWNQLAVLGCLQDGILTATMNYLRALTSIIPFPRGIDNLSTLCRRTVNIPEERMSLAEDSALAALYGLVLRLIAVLVVHEISNNTHSVHLENIKASLGRLLNNQGVLPIQDERDAETLVKLFCCGIFAVEYLSKGEHSITNPVFLSMSQQTILEWLFNISEKIVTGQLEMAMAAPSILCLWFINSTIIERIQHTFSLHGTSSFFALSFRSFMRSLCEYFKLRNFSFFIVESNNACLPEDGMVLGTAPFGMAGMKFNPSKDPDTARKMRILNAVKFLAEKSSVLIYDPDTEGFQYREDYEKLLKREQMNTKLAKQKLAGEVSALQSEADLYANPQKPLASTWHIFDSESLLANWDRIEPLVASGLMKIVVPLTTLRFLDHAKTSQKVMSTARQVMRFIASKGKSNPSPVHLQHPHETCSNDHVVLSKNLGKHHIAMLGAINWYNKEWEGKLAVVTEDAMLREALEQSSLDFVHCESVSEYLKENFS